MEKGYQIKYIISIGGKIWITKCDMCTIICMPNVPLRSVKRKFWGDKDKIEKSQKKSKSHLNNLKSA